MSCRGNILASRSATDILYVLLRSVTLCQVLLRSPRSTTTQKVDHFRCGCGGNFLDSLKICPGNHGELRLSIPFPYVVPRSPCFVHSGRKRDCRGRWRHSVNVALAIFGPKFYWIAIPEVPYLDTLIYPFRQRCFVFHWASPLHLDLYFRRHGGFTRYSQTRNFLKWYVLAISKLCLANYFVFAAKLLNSMA